MPHLALLVHWLPLMTPFIRRAFACPPFPSMSRLAGMCTLVLHNFLMFFFCLLLYLIKKKKKQYLDLLSAKIRQVSRKVPGNPKFQVPSFLGSVTCV